MNPTMMRATAEIFVIFEEPDARTRQAFLLNSLGLPFQDVDVGPAPLAGEWRLGRGITHLILPVGLNILLLLRQVRSSFPDATVLAVGEFSAIDRRIHAYMAGADNCLSAQAGPEELAAVLQAIRRKGGADARRVDMAQAVAVARADEDGGRQGVWVLSDGGWMLAAADGTRIDLRKSERTLLQWFAHHEGMEARRNDTISAADGSSITGRWIDVVISRLKRRAEMLGVTLPIRSVRGRGYVFVGHLSVGRNEHSLEEGLALGP